jgi:antitoxin component of MazEF toxin-antitoxin module
MVYTYCLEVIDMPTTIAQWGNSAAVRVPAEAMRRAGLSRGDLVELEVNERGNLELMPQATHRVGRRRRMMTFNELFADYDGARLDVGDPWNDGSYVGTEKEAWS